jgi:hypothetical protein
VVLLIAALCALPLRAQVNTGRISGAIADQTGGAVACAMVTATNVARGVSRPVLADAAGQYAVPKLTPGTYAVHAEFKGFPINAVIGSDGPRESQLALR